MTSSLITIAPKFPCTPATTLLHRLLDFSSFLTSISGRVVSGSKDSVSVEEGGSWRRIGDVGGAVVVRDGNLDSSYVYNDEIPQQYQ